MSFARSMVEIVGDLSAAALPAVTGASTSASTGFNDRIRPYALSGTGRARSTALSPRTVTLRATPAVRASVTDVR